MQQQQQQSSARCPRCGAPDPWVSAFDSCSRCCPASEQLISKKTAKELYLLTDGDLRGLGSLLRANPHGATLAPMRLFLESQVRAVAAQRHGVSVAGTTSSSSSSRRRQQQQQRDYEEYDDDEGIDDRAGEEEEGGFIKPSGNSTLEARLEAARLERLERRLSTRAAKRAADASRDANAAAKLASARAAVEERSRLELDEGQRVAKKKRKTEGKGGGEKNSSGESGGSGDERNDSSSGVEVETI